MKMNYLLIALWLISFSAFAQLDSDKVWYHGSLYLSNGQSEEGMIYIGFEQQAVMVRQDQRLKTFHWSQVSACHIFDHINNTSRRFVGIRTSNRSEGRVLFEQIISGEISLLKRYKPQVMFNESTVSTTHTAQYFIMNQQGEMIKSSSLKKRAGSIFKNNAIEIDQYIKNNKYKFTDISHVVKLIRYYNILLSRQVAAVNPQP